jgi:hypothetical protein
VPEPGIDLAGQILPDGAAGPGIRVLQVEVDRGPLIGCPVLDPGVGMGPQHAEQAAVLLFEFRERQLAALLLRADEPRLSEAADQVVADLGAQVRDIVVTGDLVADDGERHVVPGGVVAVLPVHGHTPPGGLGDEERQVEPGEQPGGERVRAGGHVDHHVLAGPVDQVVEV